MSSKDELRLRRNTELAAIHIAKKELGLDDDTYRDVLWSICRVRSAAELDAYGRQRILDHFKSLGWNNKHHKLNKKRPQHRPHPSSDRMPLISKIDALLGNRPRDYADGIAKQMFGIRKIEWCNPEQLRKIVAALIYDQKRKEK